ncbi:hypothetical protein [Naasia lichenicola]|uniref:hypothetical protein n=1 Tax=Naasia lichenicola TaxID=2565933 RepID=UPI001E419435|nr:hypothetical protein [Naasia lichenicola]
MVHIPKHFVLLLGAIFSAYHVVLAWSGTSMVEKMAPLIVAIAIYALATVISLWPKSPNAMPMWMAALNVGVSLTLCFLVTSGLDPAAQNGYATWHVAAIGTLMTITAVRGQYTFAWIGVGALVLQTIVWAGPLALLGIGVIGSVVWVGVAHMIARALAKAARDARQFALAEREAAEWQAGQEAHLYERQFRLMQTSRVALPMLQKIALSGGNLSEEDREECFHLEGALRDEIRGRRLLNDAVRAQIMILRRAGTQVSLLDDGGVDDLDEAELARVLDDLANTLVGLKTDRVIIRTVPQGSAAAVTIVALSAPDGSNASLLSDDHDDEVDLWKEIPRDANAVPVLAGAWGDDDEDEEELARRDLL